MTSTRLKMSQEGLLWKAALEHLGPIDLHQVVVELWTITRPPARTTVEYLDSDYVGGDVLNLLRIAQIAVGAAVPYRPVESGRIAIYSAHAEHLAHGLLQAMPVGKLPPSLKGARLEAELGM
ncbi:hypothetical protein K3369_29260 [Pseudomonas mandelii]|uniref:hypothetical protein n=1 Tax=Pseudomonas mandelii TaxID=75612 RepID=UPI001C83208C|nr:hypothetical protein [Pseudomonas mandelii]QZA97751.1 hypothetical protein K3369_29260 [Pseudomonas mandelii]